ncbi:dihydrofolate reductase family protein [Hamadaea sp. NPDC050747]|uniref:dihydrofolate reductase family protein n=1 Tax=Hamadaea sp. NPDC050747 TaxID=3155789 RepID=UPI0033D8214E
MRLTMTTFITLDGVYQGPGGPEEDTGGGFTQGGWFQPYFDEEVDAFMDAVFSDAEGFVLGRKTYDIFAAYWPKMADQPDPISQGLNHLPKYVVSHTLTGVDWNNSRILSGDPVAEVAKLKEQPGKELQIHGSGVLGASLIDARLVDTLRLVVCPVVLGSGRRLFGEGRTPTAFHLRESRATPSGVALQVFDLAGDPTYGTFGVE